MAETRSALYRLLAEKIGKDPVEDMAERRNAGESWRTIEQAYLLTHGVSVTTVTLRTWWEQIQNTPSQ